MGKMKNVCCGFIRVFCMLSAVIAGCSIMYLSADARIAEEKQKCYLIVTDSNKKMKELKQKFKKDIYIDYSTYDADNNEVLSVELSDEEADKLENASGVKIEEDYCVNVCGNENYKERQKANIVDGWKQVYKDMINVPDNVSDKELKTGEKIKIAVLDSGVDRCSEVSVHSSINLVPGQEELTPFFEDETGHGTAVAGIIATIDTDSSVTGINNNAEIYSAKVFDAGNTAPVSRIIEGIYWAIDNKVDIINMSFGMENDSEALKRAIDMADEAGILMIAAAGNDEEKGVLYPAAYDCVMGIGAVDTRANHSEMSAVGEGIDVVAVGEQVVTTGMLDGCIVADGTSMAVPQVAAIASLLWEKDRNVSGRFIRELINAGANNIGDADIYGFGLADYEESLRIYDEFKENYNPDTGGVEAGSNSSREMETFELTDCVSGQWETGTKKYATHGHIYIVKDAINESGEKFSTSEVKAIKQGCVFNDTCDKLSRLEANGDWHGRSVREYNFVGAFAYLYNLALNDLDNYLVKPAYMQSPQYQRMKKKFASVYKNGKNSLISKELNNAGISYTTSNKKYFVLGMALHILADTYAHSAYQYKDNKYHFISHKNDKPDKYDFIEERYKAAKAATVNAIRQYSGGNNNISYIYSNIKAEYYDDSKYKIRGLESKVRSVDNNISSKNAGILKKMSHCPKKSDRVNNSTKKSVLKATAYSSQDKNLDYWLFDYIFYYNMYSDLQTAVGFDYNALKKHYETFGKKEGRMASVFFDPVYYIDTNPDVEELYGRNYAKAYQHFVNVGFWEGRRGSKIFDAEYYTDFYDDLYTVYDGNYYDAMRHFRMFGLDEMRKASDEYEVQYYMDNNADLAALCAGNPFYYTVHFAAFGKNQNRICVDIDNE